MQSTGDFCAGVTMDLEAKLALMPSQPGVYLMKNGEGTILYVGKAKNLRSRVRSYFRKSGRWPFPHPVFDPEC